MSNFEPVKDDGDCVVAPAKPQLKKPPLYKVVLLNDDFTPMNFVVDILIDFFNMTYGQATDVMLQIHNEGIGVCGIFSKDVAETKVHIVNDFSLEQNHPLKCSMEAT